MKKVVNGVIIFNYVKGMREGVVSTLISPARKSTPVRASLGVRLCYLVWLWTKCFVLHTFFTMKPDPSSALLTVFLTPNLPNFNHLVIFFIMYLVVLPHWGGNDSELL